MNATAKTKSTDPKTKTDEQVRLTVIETGNQIKNLRSAKESIEKYSPFDTSGAQYRASACAMELAKGFGSDRLKELIDLEISELINVSRKAIRECSDEAEKGGLGLG